jgi:hypothetical protein
MKMKISRRPIATPAPRTMPMRFWLSGSPRQASAMTTALSPDKTMLMPMI